MFIFGHFFIAVAKLLGLVFNIFYFVLVIRIIMSWVNPDPYNELVRIIYRITDPVLVPIRKYIPIRVGMIDFSPMIAFLLLYFLNYFVVNTLFAVGQSLL